MIVLDGGIYSQIDLYLLAALTLSAVTGQPFEMKQVGLRAKSLNAFSSDSDWGNWLIMCC